MLAGSFAVICLMTGKVVSQYSGQVQALALGNGTAPAVLELPVYSPLEVATAVTFMVAIYQVSLLFRVESNIDFLSLTQNIEVCKFQIHLDLKKLIC